jgi:hypothetical protein
MPIVTVTVTPEMRATIENLNRLLRAKEEYAVRTTRGGSYEHPSRNPNPVCDACQERLSHRCVNVVIGLSGATSVEGEPMAEVPGSIVVRYHRGCYAEMSAELPKADKCKDLTQWINMGYGRRRTHGDDEAAS